MTVSENSQIKEVQERAKSWLFNSAAPLWSTKGVLSDGMFAERLSLSGEPVIMGRRLRVQARQIYAYAEIGRLGWEGPWQAIIDKAVEHLISRGRRDDGLFVHMFDETGSVSNSDVDLYDQAFGLFALAHAATALQREDLLEISSSIQKTIDKKWARPSGGYWEGQLTPCPPYRQNPHMHMFEAALANYRASGYEHWRATFNRLADLFESHFQDATTGAVTEYFDENWRALDTREGKIVEPGHCLEWAWLFEVGFPGSRGEAISDRLTTFARSHGLCAQRHVAINEVLLDGTIIDAGARLWPQTERLKAAVARFKRQRTESEKMEIIAAYEGLERYFDTPIQGVWHDRWLPDGSFLAEDAPASSFYHIVCALNELLRI